METEERELVVLDEGTENTDEVSGCCTSNTGRN